MREGQLKIDEIIQTREPKVSLNFLSQKKMKNEAVKIGGNQIPLLTNAPGFVSVSVIWRV